MKSSRFFKPLIAVGLVNIIAKQKQARAEALDQPPSSRYWTKDGLPTQREKQCKEHFDRLFSQDPEALSEFQKCMQEAQQKDREEYFALQHVPKIG